ncbi:MAG: TonB-dependent receptor [Bryobacteraceae bacterium]|nr:TonB-dependent receptor [Bryobacteraceae bacterium]MDW8376872.1 TonB-dependent receptor [Bryobacterales bacterium]
MKFKLTLPTFVMASSLCFAQGEKSSISGAVLDPADQPVEGARVVVVSRDSGASWSTLSSSAGVFRIPSLPTGWYSLSVQKEGFREYRIEQVQLLSGQDFARNLRLELSAVHGEVTVVGTVPEIQRDGSAGVRGATYSPSEVENVPLLASGVGRNYRTLAYQTPGVGFSRTGHAPFTVNGNRPLGAINTMVDSAEYNDAFSGTVLGRGMTEQPVSMETVEAFQMQTSNFKAEYGRASGAVVNLVTRRGGNQWHGSLYHFFQNEALNARNPLLTERAPLRLNMPGITLGGPLRKDHLFVFGGYEIAVRNAYRASSTITTLTEAERARAVPAVRPFLKYYPEPNIPGTNLNSQAIPSPTTTPTGLVRLDYAPTMAHRLSTRANFVRNLGGLRERLWGGDAHSTNHSGSAVLALESALSARVFNELRGTYTHFQSSVEPHHPSLGDPAINGQVGLLVVTGLPILGQFRSRNASTFHNYTVSNDLSFFRGAHIFKAGGIHRLTKANNESDRNFNGTLVFPSVAAFLAGQPLSYSRAIGASRIDMRNRETAFYFQDDWRIRPWLTLNLGLRYEYYGVPSEKYQRLGILYQQDRNNFAPRLGFAWDLGGRSTTIVRGGYGWFYSPLQMDFVGQARFAPPLVTTFSRFRPAFPDLLAGAAIGSDAYVLDRSIRNPYVQNWNLTIDRQLWSAATVVSLAYVGNRGIRLPMTSRPNGGENLNPAQRPDPARGVISYLTGAASSTYHSTQLSLRTVLVNRLSLRAAYTLSRSIDNASDAAFNPLDERNWSLDRGLSDFHQKHLVTFYGIYEVPFWENRRWLGGWQLVGLLLGRSGTPFTLLANTNTPNGTLNNRILHIPGTLDRKPIGSRWIALEPGVTVAQLQPAPGQLGTLGRNTEIGPNFIDLNVALHKHFRLGERLQAQFRVEIFNTLNRPNYETPINNLGNAAFGRILTAADPRQFQLLLKFSF